MKKVEIIFAIIELCIGIYFNYKGSDMNIFFSINVWLPLGKRIVG